MKTKNKRPRWAVVRTMEKARAALAAKEARTARIKNAIRTEFLISMTMATLRETAVEHWSLLRTASPSMKFSTEDKALIRLVHAIDSKVYGDAAERIVIGIMNKIGVKIDRIRDVSE